MNIGSLNPFAPRVIASTEITQLRVQPIKSCKGFNVKQWRLTTTGLDLDRNWMWVDPADGNKFMTIRQISKLTLIDTAFATSLSPEVNGSEDDLELVISLRNEPEKLIRIPARPTMQYLEENCKLEEVEIWGQKVDGWIYGDHVNSLVADFLGKRIALAYKGPMKRLARGNGDIEYLGREATLNFPDMMPIQVANETSLSELNSRLRGKGVREITIERFRPNIIVRGGESPEMQAWAEDEWKTLRIVTGPEPTSFFSTGPPSVTLDVCMRCARCQVPNVDPVTAEKDKREPWDTLVSYRRVDEGIKFKPCFGMLCAPRSEGTIRVGMKMELIETTTAHCVINSH